MKTFQGIIAFIPKTMKSRQNQFVAVYIRLQNMDIFSGACWMKASGSLLFLHMETCCKTGQSVHAITAKLNHWVTRIRYNKGSNAFS